MGFHADFKLNPPSTHEAEYSFSTKLIAFIEGQGLEMGGSLSSFYVTRTKRETATNADRKSLEMWLQQQPEISIVNVWPLDDAWHGPFKWL